jgi:hypothetical protein
MDTRKQQTFSMDFPWIRARLYKEQAENDAFVRQSSLTAVAVQDVTDLYIRSKSVTGEEETLVVQ